MSLDDVVATFQRWLHLPDAAPLLVVLGAVVANRLSGDPVWLFLIGPSSGGKTLILDSLTRRPEVFPTSTITEAGLLSGTKSDEQAPGATGGLLRQVGDFGIIVLKDFTSVLSGNREARAAVFAALREIYDGSWVRRLGTDGGKTLEWRGKAGLIAGCTATIDMHHATIAVMGERFLSYRLPSIDEEEQARRSLRNGGSEAQMREELARSVERFFATLNLPNAPLQLSPEEETCLIGWASLACRTRSPAERDPQRRDIVFAPPPEAPGRVARTLKQLFSGLVVIGVARNEARRIVEKVAFDSIPSPRREILETLREAPPQGLDVEAVAERARCSNSVARRCLDEFLIHRVVERRSGAKRSAELWSLSEWARNRAQASERPEICDFRNVGTSS